MNFDFGLNAPEPEKFDPKEFSIGWRGAVLAPETGDYEFIVKTEHSIRLWVNDVEHPLIDAWVKSGKDTEFRGSIYLLAGRAYPIRLEFSKAKQGVADSKEKKEKAPVVKASIALEWKLPLRPAEVIPARNLSPGRFSEVFVPSTPFPPDDRSVGYERGTSVSKAWDQATTDAALEVADYVATHLKELAGVGFDSSEREGKLRDFCLKFAERAFRRPLTRRGEGKVRRSPVRPGGRPGDGGQAGPDPGAQVAEVPLPRGRQPGRLRRRLPALVRPLGLDLRPGTLEGGGQRPAQGTGSGPAPGRADG